MTGRDERPESRSPLITAADLAAHGVLPSPAPHTGRELDALLGLLTPHRPGITTVAVGHSRDDSCRRAAEAFTAAWENRGGTVLATVDWPETAASWLRPATRLTAGEPDAWVIAAAVPGFAQLARRLRHSTDWDPARTYAFASLQDSRLPALAGPRAVHGLRGATGDGGTWQVRHRWIVSRPPA
ncbi:ABC transporter substrate-binding protein [Streptomyces sp. Tu 3180]|uniref:ABC transporter substrate-binding protein n=1 Tax=Streptomyces sp. Tu 3180 TaxID=2682611 RepID=UPI0013589C7D|nr:ABC transporter substrate-binding protein [Streptomyces sp. Tu 3180]KAF3468729.1 ABC transporter substrate-binding protein [Streptomyces sp. Tu 3180]